MEDRRKGCLYGQAIGDALGAYYEFDAHLGRKERARYKETQEGFKPGEWTDDTEQALVLALAFGKATTLEDAIKLTAKGFQKWLVDDGRGCGNHTSKVLTDMIFAEEPLVVSKAVWEDGGKQSAPNGGVMRAAGTAIVRPWDLDRTITMAKAGCIVTHWDPRCVASVVAHNVACHYLITGGGIKKAMKEALKAAVAIEPGIEEFLTVDSLTDLSLNDRGKGYTYKCVGAGFWALQEFQRCEDEMYDDFWCDRFRDILEAIIRERGDTDTNAAVAGALVGAHMGFKNMELLQDLVGGLQNKNKLDRVLAHLPVAP